MTRPVPNGYRVIELGGGTISLLTCLKCGALVLMNKTHTEWHKKNDR